MAVFVLTLFAFRLELFLHFGVAQCKVVQIIMHAFSLDV